MNKLLLTLICALYIIILFIGATAVKPSDVSKAPGFDKVLHFGGFFILTILLIVTFDHHNLHNSYLFAIIIALVIGMIIELVQIGTPGRVFSLLDLAADLGGASLASAAMWLYSGSIAKN
jgi:VanZ family protein